jgi:macrolide-specific efflux system membrane fusion protein
MDSAQDNKTMESFLPAGRKKRKKGIVGLVVIIVIAAAGSYYWSNRGEDVVETQPLLTPVRIGDIENTIAATGSLKPFETVEVGAQVSGQLLNLYVEAGDVVGEGQLLAEIYANQQEQRVESSRASLAGQEAQLESRVSALELAQANAERQRRLMAADATSQLDFDNAMNQLAAAEANLIQAQRQIDQSRANLDIEEQELSFTRIVAPISGTVISVAMTEGRTLNAVQQAPTILTIADLTKMSVEAEISEADVSSLRNGMEVYFTTLGGGNRRWNSTLRQILPQPTVTNNVVLYTGLFDIENNDGTLLPEMTAQIYFVTSAARNVLTVPIGALTFNEGGPASAGSGFNDMMASAGGRQGPFNGAIPTGARSGAIQDGAGGAFNPRQQSSNNSGATQLATVQVQTEDGAFEEREIIVGLTSRVAAEVISGLQPGELVVSGVVQGNVNGVDRDQLRSALGLPGGR